MSNTKCLYCGCQIYDPISGMTKIHDPEKCQMNPSNQKSDCSNHPRDLMGEKDTEKVAAAISNLNYETLGELLSRLGLNLYQDGLKDRLSGREHLGYALNDAADNIAEAAKNIHAAWQISKPFMENQTINHKPSPISVANKK